MSVFALRLPEDVKEQAAAQAAAGNPPRPDDRIEPPIDADLAGRASSTVGCVM